MKWAPFPMVPDFFVDVSPAYIRLDDLLNSEFGRMVSTTRESALDIGERPVIGLTEHGGRWLNEYVVRQFLRGMNAHHTYLAALQFTPSDPIEEAVVHYCVSELAAIRHARTSAPFEDAPRFNPPDRTNQGLGKSRCPHPIHWREALSLLEWSPYLHEIVANRIFGKTPDQLCASDYEKLLAYQVGRKSANDHRPKYSKTGSSEGAA